MGLRRKTETPALREVVERQYARDDVGLVAQLHDTDASVRRRAVHDLAGRQGSVEALFGRMRVEDDRSVLDALFTAIAAHPGKRTVELLLDLLRTEDAVLRNGAIEALAMMPAEVGPRISAMLHDPDSDVRILTVNLLGELRHANVRRWLAEVLARETHVNVVAAAIEVLAEVGTPEELDVLRAVRERLGGDAFVVFAADVAIERIAAE
jgi:HEAT repeat protein